MSMAMTRRRLRPTLPDASGRGGLGVGWVRVAAIAVKVSGGLGKASEAVATGPECRRRTFAAHDFVTGRHAAHGPDRVRPPTLNLMEQQPDPGFAPGLTARVQLTVTDSDTAQAVGSGDVPMLGTPRLLALAEAATVAATATRMPPGMTTVGTRIELEHRAPTPVGRVVVAHAQLAKVDGRRLLFEFAVTDGPATVAEGRVERALVDRHRFVARAFDPPSGAGSADTSPSGTSGGLRPADSENSAGSAGTSPSGGRGGEAAAGPA
jgi:fluoroacetyl-CoA thioesterase